MRAGLRSSRPRLAPDIPEALCGAADLRTDTGAQLERIAKARACRPRTSYARSYVPRPAKPGLVRGLDGQYRKHATATRDPPASCTTPKHHAKFGQSCHFPRCLDKPQRAPIVWLRLDSGDLHSLRKGSGG